jgi:hypothetical protein
MTRFGSQCHRKKKKKTGILFIVQQQHVWSVMTFVTCAYLGTGLEFIFELVDVHIEGFVPMMGCL